MTPAETRERARFKGKAQQLQLVDAIFQNSRALAKVTSAAEYVVQRGDDAWPLYAALEQLVAERRPMRAELERLTEAERETRENRTTRPAAATA